MSYDPAVSDGWSESDPGLMPLDRLLSRTGRAVARHHQRALAEHGLTRTSLGVLGVLTRATTGVSHRELAARLGLTPATLTPVVDGLEDAGELTRERDPGDRRVVRLAITPQGRARFGAASAAVGPASGERLPGPSPEQEPVIRAYLLAVLAAAGDDGPVR